VVEAWQAENPCYAENKKTNMLQRARDWHEQKGNPK
jgi:hypothetical protein